MWEVSNTQELNAHHGKHPPPFLCSSSCRELKSNAVRSTYAEVGLLADTAIYCANIIVKILLVDLICKTSKAFEMSNKLNGKETIIVVLLYTFTVP